MNDLRITYAGSVGPYVVLRYEDNTVWNGTANVAYSGSSYAGYDIPLIDRGGNLWTADFPEDAPSGNYEVQYREYQTANTPLSNDPVLLTDAVRWNGTTTSSVGTGGVGYYTNQTAMELLFGEDNVAIWSNKDSDSEVANATAVQSALDITDRYIDSRLDFYGWTAPLSTSAAAFDRVSDLATTIAGGTLQMGRGLTGDGKIYLSMRKMKKEAEAELDMLILTGVNGGVRAIADEAHAPFAE